MFPRLCPIDRPSGLHRLPVRMDRPCALARIMTAVPLPCAPEAPPNIVLPSWAELRTLRTEALL